MVFLRSFELVHLLVILVDVVNYVVKWKFITGIRKANNHIDKVENMSSDINDV